MKTNYKNKTILKLAILLALIVLGSYITKGPGKMGIFYFAPVILILASIILSPLQGFIFGFIASIVSFLIGLKEFINLWQFLFEYPLRVGVTIAIGSFLWRFCSKRNWLYFPKILILSFTVILTQWFFMLMGIICFRELHLDKFICAWIDWRMLLYMIMFHLHIFSFIWAANIVIACFLAKIFDVNP